jgi:RNA polymerase sigma-70 factor (ECF subfamily)
VKDNLLNDSDILHFSKGDMDAYASIYHKYQQIVFTNISKIIMQQHVAEDILQDVFFKLWQNKHQFKDENSLAAWLFTVSYNQSISCIRKIISEKKYLSFHLQNVDDTQLNIPEAEAIIELKQGLLTDAISKLPTRKKQVFELCKLQGKSYAEAAMILGLSQDTVKEYMVASLKFVKSYVRSKYATESIAALSFISIYLAP